MRYRRLMRAGLFGVALLTAGAAAADEVPVAFGTAGGDAWSFSKSLDITVPAGRCDQIVITSPVSVVTLPAGSGEVHTDVSLQPGRNQINAECRGHGVGLGSAQQDWKVRLRNTPTASIRAFESGSGLVLDGQASLPAPVRAGAITRYEWRARDGNPGLAGLPASGVRIELSGTVPDGE
jgi:hypothetical protein